MGLNDSLQWGILHKNVGLCKKKTSTREKLSGGEFFIHVWREKQVGRILPSVDLSPTDIVFVIY